MPRTNGSRTSAPRSKRSNAVGKIAAASNNRIDRAAGPTVAELADRLAGQVRADIELLSKYRAFALDLVHSDG